MDKRNSIYSVISSISILICDFPRRANWDIGSYQYYIKSNDKSSFGEITLDKGSWYATMKVGSKFLT